MKPTVLVAGIVVLAGLGTTGCVMPDQVSAMQKDLAAVQRQVQESRREQNEALTKLADLESRTGAGGGTIPREELANLAVRLDSISREVAINQERMTDLNRRLDRVAEDVQATRELARRAARVPLDYIPTDRPPLDAAVDPDDPEAEPTVLAGPRGTAADPPRRPLDAVPDPDRLYNTAYADFSKGNYALAVGGFLEYQQRFPDSPQADNALYWIGECHFSQGDFESAIGAFDRLLETYPNSDKAAAGNLKKALAFLEQNQIGQAIVQLRFVVASYPGSDESRIARDKLTSLGAPV